MITTNPHHVLGRVLLSWTGRAKCGLVRAPALPAQRFLGGGFGRGAKPPSEVMTRPIELIPSRRQALWGWPAVLNFALGGLGAGLYVVAAAAAGFDRSPTVTAASWLGPLLVLAGFVAVATEAGRPFRGPRVLTRLATSWMSRELWIGGAFVLFVATDLAFPLRIHRALAVAMALALALAQGFIVRRARGVTAWDVPLMPLLFLFSALISGSGLYLVIEVISGRRPDGAVLGGVLALLAGGLFVWTRYIRWSVEPAFAEAIAPLTSGRGGHVIVCGGYTAPLGLIPLGVLLPAVAPLALLVAGALMVGAQFHAKTLLILSAGQFRPITLAGLRMQKLVGEKPDAAGLLRG
jgi:DMSO reductase anchor subunit